MGFRWPVLKLSQRKPGRRQTINTARCWAKTRGLGPGTMGPGVWAWDVISESSLIIWKHISWVNTERDWMACGVQRQEAHRLFKIWDPNKNSRNETPFVFHCVLWNTIIAGFQRRVWLGRGTAAFTEDVEFYKTEPMLFFRCVLGSAWNNRVLFNLG